MPINKKQVIRMIKFVAELRKNSYPNAASFVRKLREADLQANMNISCSERTIARDLEVLRNEFNAPIEFSPENNGYYLTNQYWNFQVPVQAEEAIIGALLGARLVEDIMPSPVKETIKAAVDDALTTQGTDFFDEAYLESLLIASACKTIPEPAVFEKVFQAWRTQRRMNLTYKKGIGDRELSERIFDPHIIAFHNGNWYTKGVDQTNNKIIVLAIFRIQKAQFAPQHFDLDKKILEDTRKNGLFDYPKIENITVRCSAKIAYYLYEQQKAKKLQITANDDGSLTVILPPSPEHEAIRWILGEGGNAEVLEPKWLREKIYKAAKNTVKVHS